MEREISGLEPFLCSPPFLVPITMEREISALEPSNHSYFFPG
jgi:hypothetical protein